MKSWIDLVNNIQNDTYRYTKKALIAFLCAIVGFLFYPYFHGKYKTIQSTGTGTIVCNFSSPTQIFLLKELPRTGK